MNDPIVSTIGLIADTHYQDRLFSLPPVFEKWWTGVDLILHAGDIGESGILDHLGRLAPTIAVHGNDEPDNTVSEFPEQQVIALHGVRILLWHSHYPDPVEEMANRQGAWLPKLTRIARRGQEVNAQVVVYGHTHVPIVHLQDGILITNPGALAAGSHFTRQLTRTVAKLQIFTGGKLKVAHFDVDIHREIALPEVPLDEEFERLAWHYQEWIVEPGMIPAVGVLQKIPYEDVRAVVRALIPLYQQALQDGPIRLDDFMRAVNDSDSITQNDKKSILNAMGRH